MKRERYKRIFEPQENYGKYIYFQEETFDVDKEVDRIYNKYFKKFVKDFSKNIIEDKVKKAIQDNRDISFGSFSSKDLVSQDSKKAHNINPVIINAGIFRGGSYYDYKAKEISLSINDNTLGAFLSFNFDDSLLLDRLGKNTLRQLKNEV